MTDSAWGEMSAIKLEAPRALFSSVELRILITVCLTHNCIGYAMGAISPAMEPATSDLKLTDGWRGALGAAALAGNMVGSPMGGWVADAYGRRRCIMSAWTALILGSVLQALSPEVLSLCLARAAVGWAVGAHYAAITTYLSESLNPEYIGRLLSFTEFNFFTGNFMAIAVGALLNAQLNSDSLKWRTTLFLSAIPTLFTLSYFAYCLPESQPWLDAKNKVSRVHDLEANPGIKICNPTTQICNPLVCSRTGHCAVQQDSMPQNAQEGQCAVPEQHGSSPSSSEGMSTGKSIVFVSSFWGSLVVPTYAVSAFAVAIISELGLAMDAFTLNTFLAAAVASGVALGIPLVDFVGRKPLLLLSQWGVAGAFCAMAFLQPLVAGGDRPVAKLALITAFVAFEVLNGCGAPLALVYPAEIFRPEVKGLASGISAMNSRIMAISVIMTMSALLSSVGIASILLGLGIFSAIGALLTHAMAP
ncbi:putative transporter [Gregarina niphandrodes]|uniref:Transporter n=1 Tax=Gregarina niphandrodes TaxID=110365 RepID=A0A023B0Q7_GRENI|nr:putative transporter [Gregarina niphandrodes]EZG44827.1 putative transporter [Gregarina niphandrodes]|eukprot:XP_011132651.1 putative transporter [Gregarina niphandrodes]